MKDQDDKRSQKPEPEATDWLAPDAETPLTADDPTIIDDSTALHHSDADEQTQFTDMSVGVDTFFEHPSSEALSQQLMVGQRIKDRFEIVALLGRGGMGSVYKALDLRKQEARDRQPFVALKSLNEDFARHPQALIALQREARKSQSLAHPNIVTVYDFDRADDRVYMTMEYLRGQPLDRVIAAQNETGKPKEEVLPLIKDMCAALSYAHSQNIAHADLKPANVFVTEKGAKILDFGIARAVADIGGGGDQTVFDPAELGALTPAYASYEMLNGAEPEPKDDVFALACIIYELLTGLHPYQKRRADEAEQAGLKPARPTVLNRREWRALEKALAFRREDRLADVDALQTAFEPKSPLVLWAGAAVVLLIAGASWLSLQQGQEIAKVDTERLRETVVRETRIDLARQDLLNALQTPALNEAWLVSRSAEAQNFVDEVPGRHPELTAVWHRIASDWLSALEQRMQQWKTASADQFEASERDLRTDIALVKDWLSMPLAAAADSADYQSIALGLEHLESEINGFSAQRNAERAAQAAAAEAARREAEQKRLAEEAVAERRRQQQAAKAAAAAKQQNIDALVATIRSELSCDQNGLSQRSQDWQALMALQSSAAQQTANRLQDHILSCLKAIEPRSTASAQAFLDSARQNWPGFQRVAAWRVDDCADTKPGDGSSRARCSDRWGNGKGPELVAMPPMNGQRFLLARYETSIAEFNQFCRHHSGCKPAQGSDRYPVTGRPVGEYQAYLKWLSDKSGFVYRFPSFSEWRFSHPEDRGEPDPNRNCVFEGLGIRKGGRPISVRSGKPAYWGTVNALGNAAEAVSKNGQWLAVGGSHSDALDRCLPDMRRGWDGSPDDLIGLRPLRELRN